MRLGQQGRIICVAQDSGDVVPVDEPAPLRAREAPRVSRNDVCGTGGAALAEY